MSRINRSELINKTNVSFLFLRYQYIFFLHVFNYNEKQHLHHIRYTLG